VLNIEIYEVLAMFIVATTAGYSSFSRNKLAAIIGETDCKIRWLVRLRPKAEC